MHAISLLPKMESMLESGFYFSDTKSTIPATMCFSAEASFIVGGSLLVIGTVIITKVKEKKDYPVALVPFIFAAQQTTEGMLWIALLQNNLAMQFWLSNLYAIFVGFIWPLYVPLALYYAETEIRRKQIIGWIGIAGFALAAYTVISIVNQPVTVEIFDNNIYYDHDIKVYPVVILLYLLATCAPFLVSSFRNLHLTGFVVTIGFCVAFFIYTTTFVSVWCFFAAIASTLILLYFTNRTLKPLIPVN